MSALFQGYLLNSPTRRAFSLFFGISVLFHLIAFLGGAYYPEGSETYMKMLTSGKIMSIPDGTPVTYGALAIISDVIAYFYKLFPAIEWFDIYIFLSSILAMSLFSLAIYTTITFEAPYRHSPRILAIVAFFSMLIYYENTRLLEVTRIALIHLSSLFIILLLQKERPGLKKTVVILLLVLPAMFVRMEAVVFSFMLIFPAFFLRIRNIKTWRVLIFIAILFIPFLAMYYIKWDAENEKYINFRAYQFGLFDYNSKLSSAFDSKEDSLCIELAKRAYVNEPRIMKLLMSEKYVQKQDKNIKQIGNYLTYSNLGKKAVLEKMAKLGKRFRILIGLIVIVWLISFLSRHTRYKTTWIILYYLLLLSVVTIFMKMEDRLLLPACMAFFLTVVMINRSEKKLLMLNLFVFAVGFIIINVKLNRTIGEQEDVCRYMSCIEKQLKINGFSVQDKMALLDLNTINLWGNRAVLKNDRSISAFSFDSGIMYMNENFQREIKERFGTTKSNEIFEIIADKRNVVWVGDEDRLTLMLDYYRESYGLDLHFESNSTNCPGLVHSKTPQIFHITR